MLSEELVDTGKNNVFAMNSFLYLAFFPPISFSAGSAGNSTLTGEAVGEG